MLPMKLIQASLILVVHIWVISAKRRRVRFINCLSTKTNSDLMTIIPARSRIECSVICLNDPHCLSASYCKTTDGYTCQLSGFYANGSCSDFVAEDACSQTAIVNPCENGGTFYHQNRTCHCVEGFVGDYCHRRYRDCRETPGEYELYTIQPFGSDYIFEWKCYQEIYFVTSYQHYFNFNYTKGWQMMRQGIPIQTGLFFMGLEPLQLTKQGTYDMCVALSIYYPGYRLTGYLWYRNVRVDSEADGYALHWDYFEKEQSYNSSIYLDGFGGLGDATKNLNGARFGTYDRDVAGCARAQIREWWYNELGCTTLKFVHNGVMWPTNRTGTITLEFVNYFDLRIKSVDYFREDDLVL